MLPDQALSVPDSFEKNLRFDLIWNSSVNIDIATIMCDKKGTKIESYLYKNSQSLNGGSSSFNLELDKLSADVYSVQLVANTKE